MNECPEGMRVNPQDGCTCMFNEFYDKLFPDWATEDDIKESFKFYSEEILVDLKIYLEEADQQAASTKVASVAETAAQKTISESGGEVTDT